MTAVVLSRVPTLQLRHWLTRPARFAVLRRPDMTTEESLAELRSSPTDLGRFVEAAASSDLPYMLVPVAALKGWRERDPAAWGKVVEWLTTLGRTVVEV